MFAVAYWVINRAENIQDPRIADLLRRIRLLVFVTYVLAIFMIALFPFSVVPSFPPTSSLTTTSYISFLTLLLLSYPFAYIIGMIQALVILDTMIDALRGGWLLRRRRRPWSS